MADTHRQPRWTLPEFLAWEERQENRNEFVDGRVRAMVGGTRRRNAIALNVASFLSQRLRGGKCAAYGSDMKTVTPSGNVRYADVTVDCGPMKGDDVAATEPTLVVEVLSKSTSYVDQSHKLDDYQSIPSMRHILHLSQDRVDAALWSRDDKGWRRVSLAGLDALVDLPAIGVQMSLRDAYDGVTFELDPDGANDA